jgi:hypothetical protein
MAAKPMTVRAGSSAMVATLHGETVGGSVYLYDAVTAGTIASRSARSSSPTQPRTPSRPGPSRCTATDDSSGKASPSRCHSRRPR